MKKSAKKVMVEIPEYGISFECNNAKIEHFVRVREVPSSFTNIVTREPFGEKILLITDGLPDEILSEIKSLIKQYCGH